jgi:hypothetical protein
MSSMLSRAISKSGAALASWAETRIRASFNRLAYR